MRLTFHERPAAVAAADKAAKFGGAPRAAILATATSVPMSVWYVRHLGDSAYPLVYHLRGVFDGNQTKAACRVWVESLCPLYP